MISRSGVKWIKGDLEVRGAGRMLPARVGVCVSAAGDGRKWRKWVLPLLFSVFCGLRANNRIWKWMGNWGIALSLHKAPINKSKIFTTLRSCRSPLQSVKQSIFDKVKTRTLGCAQNALTFGYLQNSPRLLRAGRDAPHSNMFDTAASGAELFFGVE